MKKSNPLSTVGGGQEEQRQPLKISFTKKKFTFLQQNTSASEVLDIMNLLLSTAGKTSEEITADNRKIREIACWVKQGGIPERWNQENDLPSKMAYALVTDDITTVDWTTMDYQSDARWPEVKTSLAWSESCVRLARGEGDKIEPSPNNVCYFNAKKINLEGKNLKNHDRQLVGGDFSNANFKKADLTFANLTNANLMNANFDEANIAEVKLQNADVEGADFQNAFYTFDFIEEAGIEFLNRYYSEYPWLSEKPKKSDKNNQYVSYSSKLTSFAKNNLKESERFVSYKNVFVAGL
ncbi:MAG: pentapeptide repeat-containing protein, partial [Gammaproteobacteria bacterium]